MYVHMVFVCLCVFDRIESPFGGCFGQLGNYSGTAVLDKTGLIGTTNVSLLQKD